MMMTHLIPVIPVARERKTNDPRVLSPSLCVSLWGTGGDLANSIHSLGLSDGPIVIRLSRRRCRHEETEEKKMGH